MPELLARSAVHVGAVRGRSFRENFAQGGIDLVVVSAGPHVLPLCVMERVGVRELRQNLSVYLRRVRRGESLEVTERGEPVAVLRPTPSTHDPLTALAARGIALRRGRGNLAELAAPVPLDLDRSASEALQELREDRL